MFFIIEFFYLFETLHFLDRKWSKTVILMSYLQHKNFSTLTIGCDSVFTYVNSGLGALHKKRTNSIERLFW